MTDQQLTVIARGLAPVLKDAIAAATAPLLLRIAALEAREVRDGKDGADGRDGRDVESSVVSYIKADIEALQVRLDTQVSTSSLVDRIVALEACNDRPVQGPQGDRGLQGESAFETAKRLGFTGDERAWLESLKGHEGPVGSDGVAGKDGVGITGAVIDRNGQLVLMLSNGTSRNVGGVVGKDADVEGIQAFIASELAKIPTPKDGLDGHDGVNGKDGIDGKDGATLGPEDLIRLEIDPDTRTGEFIFQKDGAEARLPFAVPGLMLYRDVWKPDTVYEPGDCTTWGGSLWIAKAQTSAKPGLPTEDSRAWKLCVKAGRDGKTGAEGPKGKDGANGRDGKDLTQIDQAGRKW